MNSSVDFFAAVVALSSVMLFTKFVTHRTRDESQPVSRRLHCLHVFCVLASGVAAGFALYGLEIDDADPPLWLHVVTYIAVAIAGLILVWDGLAGDKKRIKPCYDCPSGNAIRWLPRRAKRCPSGSDQNGHPLAQ